MYEIIVDIFLGVRGWENKKKIVLNYNIRWCHSFVCSISILRFSDFQFNFDSVWKYLFTQYTFYLRLVFCMYVCMCVCHSNYSVKTNQTIEEKIRHVWNPTYSQDAPSIIEVWNYFSYVFEEKFSTWQEF